jgi:hypothetical protein
MQIFLSLFFCFTCFSFSFLQKKALSELRDLVNLKHGIMKKKVSELNFLCSKEDKLEKKFCHYKLFVREKGLWANFCALKKSSFFNSLKRYYFIKRRCVPVLSFFNEERSFFF